jgi:tryptophan-rich sensory protein
MERAEKYNEFFVLALFMMASAVAAFIASTFSTNPAAMDWYLHLNKPNLTPPEWLFGPVWTVLYVLMAIAGWRIWHKRSDQVVYTLLFYYFAQLGFNALWALLFFGLRNPFLAFIDSALMLLFIVLFLVKSIKVSKIAAWIFALYSCWGAFALYLNSHILLLL